MSKRGVQGAGTIRKKTVIRNGKQYIYWEARYTAGIDPGTGEQIQKSISGKTQSEVRKKLTHVIGKIDNSIQAVGKIHFKAMARNMPIQI